MYMQDQSQHEASVKFTRKVDVAISHAAHTHIQTHRSSSDLMRGTMCGPTLRTAPTGEIVEREGSHRTGTAVTMQGRDLT